MLEEKLYSKIKRLNETVWEGKVHEPGIQKWLENFNNTKERKHALFLLSHFIYYGSFQMRELLKALYRDCYRYKITEEIRRANNDSIDFNFINTELDKRLEKTKFVGMGNPSESGVHLLYFFRQENKLNKNLFINANEIIKIKDLNIGTNSNIELTYPDIDHYVFIDDFTGSGQQAIDYSSIVNSIKTLKPNVKVSCYMLFATSTAKKEILSNTKYDNVDSVQEMDDTFKCFSPNSRVFYAKPEEIDPAFAENFCSRYGQLLYASIIRRETKLDQVESLKLAQKHQLGYRDCQLMIGFHHNTPDNTLPIFWYDESEIAWNPIFKRYNKKYGN